MTTYTPSTRQKAQAMFAGRNRSAGSRRRRRRPLGPVGTSIMAVICVAGVIGFIFAAIANVNEAKRSSFTQHHGTLVLSTVQDVDNNTTCSRHSCSTTSKIMVSFNNGRTVAGVSGTTVHYGSRSGEFYGDQIAVMVDPHQPSYGELPGHPFKTAGSWIGCILGAIAAFLFLLYQLKRLTGLLKFRRAGAAASN